MTKYNPYSIEIFKGYDTSASESAEDKLKEEKKKRQSEDQKYKTRRKATNLARLITSE